MNDQIKKIKALELFIKIVLTVFVCAFISFCVAKMARPALAAEIYSQPLEQSAVTFSGIASDDFFKIATSGASPLGGASVIKSLKSKVWNSGGTSMKIELASYLPGNFKSFYSQSVPVSSSNDGEYYCFSYPTSTITLADMTYGTYGAEIRPRSGDGGWPSSVGSYYSSASVENYWGYINSGGFNVKDWAMTLYDDEYCGVPQTPTEAPEILEPDDGETIAQSEINDVGSEAYYWYASTGVSAYDWPSEQYRYQLEIYDTTPALFCLMDNLYYTGNIVDGTHYGTTLQHKVNGQPDPCPNFTQQEYTARLRVEREGGSGWSDWSDDIGFTVGEASFDPLITCPDDPSIFSLCWWKKLLYGLIWPDEGTSTHLWDKAQELGQVWPLCYITNSVGALVDAFDQSATDIGTPDAGNIVMGDWPNLAWVLDKAKQFWGGWASVGMAILIWLSAIKVVFNDILGIFGLTMPDDDQSTTE